MGSSGLRDDSIERNCANPSSKLLSHLSLVVVAFGSSASLTPTLLPR